MRQGGAVREVVGTSEQDGIAWLTGRGEQALPGRRRIRSRPRLARGTAKMARTLVLLGFGFVSSGAVSSTALAPVGDEITPFERVVLAEALPILPVLAPETVAALTLPPIRDGAAAALDEQRLAVEAFLRFGSRNVPRRIVETVVRAANEVGVDPIYLMALADKESSLRPDARAPNTSAEGLFQFVERTWLAMVRDFGAQHGLGAEAMAVSLVDGKPTVVDEAARAEILALRREPFVAGVMAAEMLKRDAALIGLRIGRTLNRTELYLAHFLGLSDAARFIAMRGSKRPPNAAAAFPGPARANTAIFFGRHRRGLRGLSVTEVYARLDRMIGERTGVFRDVEASLASAPRPF